MTTPRWWDPLTLVDNASLSPAVRSQLVTAAVAGDDPQRREDWLRAAARAGVQIGGSGPDGVDPEQEYRVALASARSAAEATEAHAELAGTTTASVDAILDAGAVGLRFFEQFLPLAAALAPLDLDLPTARRRYDEQRGMDVTALEADAERIATQGEAAADQLAVQQTQAGRLSAERDGRAAQATGEFLHAQLIRAGRDVDHLRRCSEALAAAAGTLRSVVRDKVAATAGLYTGEVGGRTAAQIELMMRLGADLAPPDHAAAAAVTGWWPPVPGVAATAPVAAVRVACQRWLHEVFVPSMRSRCRGFVELCDQTDAAVTATYRALAELLDETDDRAYPEPALCAAQVPIPAQAQAPAPVPPLSAPPLVPGDWRAAAPNALPGSISAGVAGVPGLSALAGDFGGQIAHEISEVGHAVEGLLAESTAPSLPVVMGRFSVDLDIASDSVSLQVTGPDGQARDYVLTIGPDGVPQLTVTPDLDLDLDCEPEPEPEPESRDEPGDTTQHADEAREAVSREVETEQDQEEPREPSPDITEPDEAPLSAAEQPATLEQPTVQHFEQPAVQLAPAPESENSGAQLAESWE